MRGRTAYLLALVGTVVGLCIAAGPAGATATRLAAALSALEKGVLSDINSLRGDHGLAPLRLSSALTAAARQHSTEMAARGYFSHNSAGGSYFDERIARYSPTAGMHFW